MKNGAGGVSAGAARKVYDECRWNYRLLPSVSRVRIPPGPPSWTRSSVDRAGPCRKAGRRSITLVVMPDDFSRLWPQVNRRIEIEGVTNACGTTSSFQVAGSIPAGAANRLRSSVGRTERQFHNRLVVTPPQETAAANARWNYSISTSGMLREVRLLTLLALSGTSGTPEFHLILSPRRLNEWRMQAGLQVARPSKDGRSGVQITLSLRGAGWRSHRLANPCRQPIEQGECLREYIW